MVKDMTSERIYTKFAKAVSKFWDLCRHDYVTHDVMNTIASKNEHVAMIHWAYVEFLIFLINDILRQQLFFFWKVSPKLS